MSKGGISKEMKGMMWAFSHTICTDIKRSNMDRKYPKVCGNSCCPIEIKWRDYLQTNYIYGKTIKELKVVMSLKLYRDFLSWYKQLKKLWKDDRVRILCCDCFFIYNRDDNYKFLIR